MKVHQGCVVTRKDSNVKGTVKRINWDDKAEVQWGDGKNEMCPVNDLKLFNIYEDLYKTVMEQIPQVHDQTQLSNGMWVIAKPLTVTLKDRIKNAWSVLCGKSFATRWY